MRGRLRSHLTYANVISSLCLFLVLGGGTAVALNGSNTVFSDDIVNGQVKQADLAKAENSHQVSPPLGDTFDCGYGSNACRLINWPKDTIHNTVAFYRDPYGVVHLKGLVCGHGLPGPPGCNISQSTSSTVRIFTLPQGYRPNKWLELPTSSHGQFARVEIRSDGTVSADGNPSWRTEDFYLDGVSFRCGPLGQNGCP